MGRNKYHNRKIEVNGQIFDSRKESRRWQELVLLEHAGEISNLQRQVKFTLIPAQYEGTGEVYTKGKQKGKPKPGKLLEREVSYYADFVYFEGDQLVVEDTKGIKTKDYIIKRKMMLYFNRIKIREV